MIMQNKIKVSIFNKQYVLATDEQEAIVLRAIERINTLASCKGALLTEELTAVTTLELAIELEKLHDELDNCSVRMQNLLQATEATL